MSSSSQSKPDPATISTEMLLARLHHSPICCRPEVIARLKLLIGRSMGSILDVQWISGSGSGSVPSRKSKSQPSCAWLMCCGEHAAVAARRQRLGPPFGAAALQLVLADQEVDLARLDVDLDHVAGPDQGQRAADRGLGRDVQDAGAVGGAAHPRVGDPHHLAHALLEQLHRQRQHAPFGHAGAHRAGVLEHQDVVGRDVEIRDR